MSGNDYKPETVLQYLTDAGQALQVVDGMLNGIERNLRAAGQLAIEEGHPYVQIAHLRGEIGTLSQIVGETVFELIRKAAEVEANSQG
jgi:hypothetical protein